MTNDSGSHVLIDCLCGPGSVLKTADLASVRSCYKLRSLRGNDRDAVFQVHLKIHLRKPGRRTGQARHPAARGPQPAGEFPTHSRAAPRLPRSLGRGRPLCRVVALRPHCAPWRPRRAARGNAHCAKQPAPRERAARLQPAPAIWIQSSPSPAKPIALPRVPDTFASGYHPAASFPSTRRQLLR